METYEVNLSSWDVEFVKSFPNFFAFAEWDATRTKPTPEDELKAVYEAIVPPVKVEKKQGGAMTSSPVVEKPKVEETPINPENDHNAE
jgi:hypothetical protein